MRALSKDLWHRIEPILEGALGLTPEARPAFLEEACAGDATLRREVEDLLAADREAEGFLSGAVGDVAGSAFQDFEETAGAPAQLSAGRELGPYRILRRLGVGGMGVVYEAEDPRLDRRVALKVLPEDMARDAGRLERFEREAKAVAALNHPNIVTIYSVERFQDVPFFTMELLEGLTLDRLIPEGGMDLDTFFDLAVPLADALAAAHEMGVTHRDLKPANVMVSDCRPKVLDFGLAKLQATDAFAAGTTTITREGTVLGTLPYMSPEQAEGKPVDSRTDIFSLGILLYEMATGQRPFHGDTPASLLSSILKDDPRPVEDLRADLPVPLGEVLRGCLEKQPDRRTSPALKVRQQLDTLRRQNEALRILVASGPPVPRERRHRKLTAAVAAAVLAAALGAVTWQSARRAEPSSPAGVPAIAEPRSDREKIVVLPFENLGPAEDEYFAAGISEEVTARLAAVGGLGVISRQSARFYAGTERTMAQIGEELGVDYVLEGTVRWELPAEGPSRMRITPQLIRVADDTHLWAEVYERDLAGIFALQSEIAERVVEQLGVKLGTSERAAIQARPTENLAAYQAYLRGRALFEQGSGSVLKERLAMESLEQAVRLDPGFALAHAELSYRHARRYQGTMDPASAEAARKNLERALELAPELPEVQLAQARYVYQFHRDSQRALEILSRVEESRPNDAEALAEIGYLLMPLGRFEEAADVLARAAKLNPRDLWAQGVLAAFVLVPLGRYAEAMEVCDRVIALGPDQRLVYDTKAVVYWLGKGATVEARAALETLPAEGPFSRLMELYQEVYERNYPAALERLSAMDDEWVEGKAWGRWPKSLLAARVYDLMPEPELAASAYAAALGLAEDELRKRPDDPEVESALGLIYAGLGRKEDAVRAGQRAVELSPISEDALYGPRYLRYLALIYTRLGEQEAAIDELDRLLSIPFFQLSVPLLELEPWWDPLRAHPRYRALVSKYG